MSKRLAVTPTNNKPILDKYLKVIDETAKTLNIKTDVNIVWMPAGPTVTYTASGNPVQVRKFERLLVKTKQLMAANGETMQVTFQMTRTSQQLVRAFQKELLNLEAEMNTILTRDYLGMKYKLPKMNWLTETVVEFILYGRAVNSKYVRDFVDQVKLTKPYKILTQHGITIQFQDSVEVSAEDDSSSAVLQLNIFAKPEYYQPLLLKGMPLNLVRSYATALNDRLLHIWAAGGISQSAGPKKPGTTPYFLNQQALQVQRKTNIKSSKNISAGLGDWLSSPLGMIGQNHLRDPLYLQGLDSKGNTVRYRMGFEGRTLDKPYIFKAIRDIKNWNPIAETIDEAAKLWNVNEQIAQAVLQPFSDHWEQYKHWMLSKKFLPGQDPYTGEEPYLQIYTLMDSSTGQPFTISGVMPTVKLKNKRIIK